ncbi:hypothetical protein ACRAWD_29270 [Caulobacter segnis]
MVPISACLGAGLLSQLLQERGKAIEDVLLTAAVYAVATALAAWVLGYGEKSGQSGGGEAMGFYSMNLLGPILPQASAVVGQAWNGQWFTGTLDANGAQTFEGFAYLGAGILLLMLAGLSRAVFGLIRGERVETGFWLRFGPILAASLVLTLWAIRTQAVSGHDPAVRPAASVGPVRRPGRDVPLPWPLLLAGRLRPAGLGRGAGRQARSRQAASGLAARRDSAAGLRHDPDDPGRAHDLRAGGAPLRSDHADRPGLRRPALAVRTPGRVRQRRGRLDDRAAVRPGPAPTRGLQFRSDRARAFNVSCDVDPAATVNAAPHDQTITAVVGDRTKQPALFDRFKARTDCYAFTRGLVCGRGLSQVPGLIAYAPLSPEAIAAAPVITLAGVRPPQLGQGWAAPEPRGTWTDGKVAVLTIDHDGSDYVLLFNLVSVFHDAQRVDVLVDGRTIAHARIQQPGLLSVHVEGDRPKGPSKVELHLPDAAPSGSGDPRLLGIGVDEIRVVPIKR